MNAPPLTFIWLVKDGLVLRIDDIYALRALTDRDMVLGIPEDARTEIRMAVGLSHYVKTDLDGVVKLMERAAAMEVPNDF